MSAAARSIPRNHSDLETIVERGSIRLGARSWKVIHFLLAHLFEAAFSPCEFIARQCGVSTAIVDRLATALHFRKFIELRAFFENDLPNRTAHSARMRSDGLHLKSIPRKGEIGHDD